MSIWVVAGAIFIGVTALVAAAGMILRDKHESETIADRLETFAGMRTVTDADVPTLLREPIVEEVKEGMFSRMRSPQNWLQNLIVQADLRFGVAPFLAVSAALAVVGVLGVMIVRAPAPMLALGVLPGILPLMFLFQRRRGRLKKFAAQLPDALELLARALRAGHSLPAGFQLVSQEMPAPISSEFQRTYEEQNFGVPLEDALKGLGERVPNMDLQFLITAIQIQRQTGGDLAEILDKLGYVIRERFKLFGQVAALTAEGRLSGWILNALPILILVALLKLNPSYVMLLFTDPLGRKMLIFAGIMQVIGAVAIRKIVNIRV
jgi:tight adherence protein B